MSYHPGRPTGAKCHYSMSNRLHCGEISAIIDILSKRATVPCVRPHRMIRPRESEVKFIHQSNIE
jgi:hypothetical protein